MHADVAASSRTFAALALLQIAAGAFALLGRTRPAAAVLAAVVIALLDLVLGSLLKLLTLPLTIITLGLFLIVINALLFWAASSMLSGFQVAGFWTAVIGAILYPLLCMLVDALLRRAA